MKKIVIQQGGTPENGYRIRVDLLPVLAKSGVSRGARRIASTLLRENSIEIYATKSIYFKINGREAFISSASASQNDNNSPITRAELQHMRGDPVWCEELGCYGIIKIETVGQWAHIPFLVGVFHNDDLGVAIDFQYNIHLHGFTLYRHPPKEGTQ